MITFAELEVHVRRELRGKSAGVSLVEDTRPGDLGLSSLQVAEIIFSLEEQYGIEFDAARAADASTLGELLAIANEALETVRPAERSRSSIR